MTQPHRPTTPPADEEHTVIKGTAGAKTSAEAGFLREPANALPPGTRVHEFEILSVVGQGGFGIVYLAHDQSLDRRVALKEYMPSSMASRAPDLSVALRSARDKDTFAAGLRSFINEARLLARFDHPALLKVHQFWEAQGTAYMAMPFYDGTTLSQLLRQLGQRPSEAWLRALLEPLLDALAQMHAAQCFHRDIAPDNIMVLPDGRPLLLDFGAARHVIADMTSAPTVILKNGYAPVEQYGEMPDMRQGAWTDLYALGSVVQYAITGRTPPQAVARFLADKREPLLHTAAGQYSEGFLRAIDRCLAVLPADRPQCVADLLLLLSEAAPGPAPLQPFPQSQTPSLSAPSAMPVQRTAPATPSAVPTGAATLGPGHTPTPHALPQRKRAWAVAAAGCVLLLLTVAGTLWWRGAGAPSEASATLRTTATSPPALQSAATGAVAPLDAALSTVAPLNRADLWGPPPRLAPPLPAAAVATSSPSVAAGPAAPAPVVRTAQTPQTPPPKKARTARCDDIIARVSLGEELSPVEKNLLSKECKQ